MKESQIKRHSILEQEFYAIVEKLQNPIEINLLKEHFYKKASINTVRNIIKNSELFILSNDFVSLNEEIFADISYTVDGDEFEKIFFNGESSTERSGTKYNVKLSGSSYRFELRIDQTRVSNFTFNTTSIRTSKGNRKLIKPVSSNLILFSDLISTIPS